VISATDDQSSDFSKKRDAELRETAASILNSLSNFGYWSEYGLEQAFVNSLVTISLVDSKNKVLNIRVQPVPSPEFKKSKTKTTVAGGASSSSSSTTAATATVAEKKTSRSKKKGTGMSPAVLEMLSAIGATQIAEEEMMENKEESKKEPYCGTRNITEKTQRISGNRAIKFPYDLTAKVDAAKLVMVEYRRALFEFFGFNTFSQRYEYSPSGKAQFSVQLISPVAPEKWVFVEKVHSNAKYNLLTNAFAEKDAFSLLEKKDVDTSSDLALEIAKNVILRHFLNISTRCLGRVFVHEKKLYCSGFEVPPKSKSGLEERYKSDPVLSRCIFDAEVLEVVIFQVHSIFAKNYKRIVDWVNQVESNMAEYTTFENNLIEKLKCTPFAGELAFLCSTEAVKTRIELFKKYLAEFDGESIVGKKPAKKSLKPKSDKENPEKKKTQKKKRRIENIESEEEEEEEEEKPKKKDLKKKAKPSKEDSEEEEEEKVSKKKKVVKEIKKDKKESKETKKKDKKKKKDSEDDEEEEEEAAPKKKKKKVSKKSDSEEEEKVSEKVSKKKK